MTLNSHILSMEINWIVSITAMPQGVCVLDCHWRFLFPSSKIYEMFPKSLTFFFLPKPQFSNEKVWCIKTKLWSKVILFQRVHGYAKTSVWFAHVTNCYYFGKRNSNKFFLTTKFIFVQSHPYWWGDFEQLWCSLFDRNTCAINWLFLHLEKRGYSGF